MVATGRTGVLADQDWVRQEIGRALHRHRREATMVAFSGNMDRLLAAMSIATESIADARDLGVRLVACQMSLGDLGLEHVDLLDAIELCGVATYSKDASESAVTRLV